jgi:hypothetical protein
MLLLIAAIGTTRMACDEGRQAFTPPRGSLSLHPLMAPVPVFGVGPAQGDYLMRSNHANVQTRPETLVFSWRTRRRNQFATTKEAKLGLHHG